MTNMVRLLLLNAVLIMFLIGGFVYVNNDTAVSTQPLDLKFIDFEIGQAEYPFLDLASGSESGMLASQDQCGNETCGNNECCCLNIDTGAQCCRSKVGDDCIESCKNSAPC